MPLNSRAIQAADLAFRQAHGNDSDFWDKHPDGRLTMSEEDEELRQEWMRLYRQITCNDEESHAAGPSRSA